MLKAVLFDLDHTLYSRELTMTRLAPAFAQAMGIQKNADETAALLIEADKCFYDENYAYRGFGAVYEHIKRSAPLPSFEAFRDFVAASLGKAATPYPFTHSVLEYCRGRGLRLGMITNGRSGMQDDKLEALGIRPYFDDLIMAGDNGILKPDPRVYLTACRHLCVRPEEAIFVGDNPAEDIDGANRAGIAAVWIRQPREYPAHIAPPAYSVQSIEELPALIDSLL